ncbi:CapA family protein [Anaerobacillus alkaliphilus]|uniref:CapA family protein n=2 Tax=Anaerobacillus alkaliphilus TaxID=1548597 RepID=A0A4Q0VN61_9BACI|nr:CapA family protein [Anaerobacillus alkaliphilus]
MEEEPVKEVFTATIAGVGDILIHESVYKDAKQPDGTYDFKPMLELVKPYIQQADVAFANQETILGGSELGLSGYPMFNSPYEVGDALIDAGFHVVSIANNHTLDKGEKAILNAIDYFETNGLLYTGAYKSEEDRATIRVLESNNIKFSFLAYSYGTNGMRFPEGKDYLINLIDVDKINDEIIRAREVSDVVVLSLHFGDEYAPYPNELQKMLAEEFTRTGADIIFGHHPHVLQPMEWIKQEDGRRSFVAYSLGNFLSGQKGIEREIGGIAQLEVVKTVLGEEITIELRDPRFLPVFTYKKNWRSYKLYPLHEILDQRHILPDAENHLEQTKKHISQWMPELRFDFFE